LAASRKPSLAVNGININREGNLVGQGEGLGELRQSLAELAHALDAEHDLMPVVSFRAEQRRGRRSHNDYVFYVTYDLVYFAFEMLGGEFDFVFVAAAQREHGNAAERRVFELLAKLDFLLVKADEIVPPRELNRGMVRGEGLDKDFAFNVTAPGAPGDLCEQLERALARAEIRLMQRHVRVNDSD